MPMPGMNRDNTIATTNNTIATTNTTTEDMPDANYLAGILTDSDFDELESLFGADTDVEDEEPQIAPLGSETAVNNNQGKHPIRLKMMGNFAKLSSVSSTIQDCMSQLAIDSTTRTKTKSKTQTQTKSNTTDTMTAELVGVSFEDEGQNWTINDVFFDPENETYMAIYAPSAILNPTPNECESSPVEEVRLMIELSDL